MSPTAKVSQGSLLAARDGLSVHALVTTRRGGVSRSPYDALDLAGHVGDDPAAVAENRRRLEARVGRPLVFMEQVHGDAVTVVDGSSPPVVAATDAVVTTSTDVALVVLVADCVPVLLADARAGVVSAVHAGRRGVLAGVVPRAWQVMSDLGASAPHTRVRLGPAICGRCYEVPAVMQEEVAAAAGAPNARTTTARGTPGLDLRAAVVQQLLAHDVWRIEVDPWCPAEDERWFSHRRDGVTGRFGGVVWAQPW